MRMGPIEIGPLTYSCCGDRRFSDRDSDRDGHLDILLLRRHAHVLAILVVVLVEALPSNRQVMGTFQSLVQECIFSSLLVIMLRYVPG